MLYTDESLVHRLTELFAAVADVTRMRIILLIFDTEQRSSDIAAALDMTASAISHQLRWLRDRRIVAGRKAGRETYYRLADDCIRQLVQLALHHVQENHPSEG
jgi:DNA-binding transcriptional ArsR family regulator